MVCVVDAGCGIYTRGVSDAAALVVDEVRPNESLYTHAEQLIRSVPRAARSIGHCIAARCGGGLRDLTLLSRCVIAFPLFASSVNTRVSVDVFIDYYSSAISIATRSCTRHCYFPRIPCLLRLRPPSSQMTRREHQRRHRHHQAFRGSKARPSEARS